MPSTDLESVVDECHRALAAVIAGDAESWRSVLSHRDEVTLGNPFGPFVRGFQDVMAAATGAAGRYRDGVITGFDRIASQESAEMAYVVEVERFEAKVGGGSELVPVALRVTSVFRREDGDWKV
ncbi:MAG: nuclear transport factor 2 family protein, partial [Acidimicrobiia bacterium]|nr:nuclear transport factor 2 family protein [Acidimicrobiia bacterium]